MPTIKWMIALGGALVTGGLGLAIGYYLRKQIARGEANSVEAKAEAMLWKMEADFLMSLVCARPSQARAATCQ